MASWNRTSRNTTERYKDNFKLDFKTEVDKKKLLRLEAGYFSLSLSHFWWATAQGQYWNQIWMNKWMYWFTLRHKHNL